MLQRSSLRLAATGVVLALMFAIAVAHAAPSGDVIVPGAAIGDPAQDHVLRDLAAAACAYAQAQLENAASMLGGTGVMVSLIVCAMASVKAA